MQNVRFSASVNLKLAPTVSIQYFKSYRPNPTGHFGTAMSNLWGQTAHGDENSGTARS